MKRCPTCNQTFSEEWLSFCTRDGTSLVDTSAFSQEPPPTVMSPPPMPPSVSPSEQPTINLPGSGGFSQQPAPYMPPPAPIQSGWQAPPPPRYGTAAPQQGLALASMIVGIFSVTLGWCYVGIISAPVALVLGIIALMQIKKEPSKYSGKPMAITGVATGSAYIVIVILLLFLGLLTTLLQK